jgi:uncharacterized protein
MDAAMPQPDPAETIAADPAFRSGLALFDAGHFWHAHESWEELWLRSADTPKVFIQGLIQVAAALVHWQRGNRRGLILNWRKARPKLTPLPSPYAGIDTTALTAWMDGMVAATIATAPHLGQAERGSETASADPTDCWRDH